MIRDTARGGAPGQNSRPSSLARPILGALVATCAVSGSLALGVALVRSPSRWPVHEPIPHQGEALDAARMPAGEYVHADAALARLIREPQNTWSNVAFVAVGFLVFLLPRAALSRGAAVALVAVGMGSFLYHASASRHLRHIDVAAMYWLYVALAVLGAAAVFPSVRSLLERRPIVVGLASAVVGFAFAASRNLRVFESKPLNLTNATIVAVAVAAGALAWRCVQTRSRSYAWWSLAACVLLAGAAAFQVADRPGGWYYHPDYPIQGHTLWHILSAAATGILLLLLSAAHGDVRANRHPSPAARDAAHPVTVTD